MIGSKTLTSLLLVVLAAAAALGLGFLRPERLLGASIGEAFFIGGFSIVVGTLMYRFWRLEEPSVHYFRLATSRSHWEGEGHFLGTGRFRITIGVNHGDAFDLGPRLQRVACLAMALLVAVGTIDARALQMLGRFPEKATFAASMYCPEVKTEVEAGDPNAPGCALIRRAYELGYTNDLGDCGKKRQSQSVSLCTLRQRDEPLLHYGWRLLSRTWGEIHSGISLDRLALLKKAFDRRATRMDTLADSQREVLASAPRASHHVWTNLPDPAGPLESRNCLDRYRTLPHRPVFTPGANAASVVFEHIVAQLLFEATYEPAAGYCREYQIHWNSPPDACEQLTASPEEFLAQSGALSSVRAALARQKLGEQLESLAAGPSALQDPRLHTQRQLVPTQFISFQCYIEGKDDRHAAIQFSVDGNEFVAEDLHVHLAPPQPGDVLVDRYRAVSALLSPGFKYGTLMSEAATMEATETSDSARDGTFSGGDFLMSHLYGLAGVDIFLEPGRIARHPDVLDVYPYHLHLKNYIQVFRQHYLQRRGRL